jgi:alanine racemase
MDLTLLDVTDHGEVKETDAVVMLGDDPDAWDLADWAGTNAWDALCSIGPRLPRVYVEDGRTVATESRFTGALGTS